MFTQNYINLQTGLFYCRSESVKKTNGKDVEISFDTVSTNPIVSAGLGRWMKEARCREIMDSATANANQNIQLYDSVGGVWFGSSQTPATKDDYTLGNAITGGLKTTSPSSVTQKNEGGGKYSISADYILRNNTEADINIYEIGLFVAVRATTTSFVNVLMERTVLTEPITIPVGEAKLVTYALHFNQTLSVD